ncbi:unnamed protein product [Triticum turgidum subsp. durum]|uniref:Uncharacterized protein n=1 Tax=Triticum turgidum subsp. durum TaxID=4567 RepID=A0A9R1B8X1_TRITD|nr:unnamed protein product [Triticum turgidum subsp. durum]
MTLYSCGESSIGCEAFKTREHSAIDDCGFHSTKYPRLLGRVLGRHRLARLVCILSSRQCPGRIEGASSRIKGSNSDRSQQIYCKDAHLSVC